MVTVAASLHMHWLTVHATNTQDNPVNGSQKGASSNALVLQRDTLTAWWSRA